jgi:hypothetical protein
MLKKQHPCRPTRQNAAFFFWFESTGRERSAFVFSEGLCFGFAIRGRPQVARRVLKPNLYLSVLISMLI